MFRPRFSKVIMQPAAMLEHICRQSITTIPTDPPFIIWCNIIFSSPALTQVAFTSSELSFEIYSFLFVEGLCQFRLVFGYCVFSYQFWTAAVWLFVELQVGNSSAHQLSGQKFMGCFVSSFLFDWGPGSTSILLPRRMFHVCRMFDHLDACPA